MVDPWERGGDLNAEELTSLTVERRTDRDPGSGHGHYPTYESYTNNSFILLLIDPNQDLETTVT